MPDGEVSLRLLDDLDGPLDRAEAVRWLGLAIEAVVENYPEYVDYNSITTQSDRGDMLYTLLDFLRLRANYDRVAWNLRPILLTHEVLVRSGATTPPKSGARPWPSGPATSPRIACAGCGT